MIEFILFAFVCAAIAFMVKNLTGALNQDKTQLKPIKIKEIEKTKSTKKKVDRF
ncbi:hypothetical protein [Marinomonas algicola]|uniref:hypothetical protein n=1 Tax=Marinomonas algicola TaxID=2773454 RepID=UPI00174E8674|nr:hypothetical protein [Marinomonas algicola]